MHVTSGTVDSPARLVNLATDVSGVLAPANGGYSWQTVLNLDFTMQTPQTMATDGAFTIAGLSWTKENSANDASSMAIDGTGLVINPANSDYSGTTRTCPLLRIPFASLPGCATMTWQSRIRVWIASTVVFADLAHRCFASVDSGPDATFGTALAAFAWKGGKSDNSGLGLGAHVTINGPQGSSTNDSSSDSPGGVLDAASQTMLLELGSVDGLSVLSPYFGAYASDFPSYYTVNRLPGLAQGGAAWDVSAAPVDVRNMGITIGCTNGDGTSGVATVQRIRVDVL